MTIEPMGSAGTVPEWDLKDRLRKAREHAGTVADEDLRQAALSAA
jgi:hypothetical protein